MATELKLGMSYRFTDLCYDTLYFLGVSSIRSVELDFGIDNVSMLGLPDKNNAYVYVGKCYQTGYFSGLYVNLFKHIKRNDYVGVISHDEDKNKIESCVVPVIDKKDLFIGV